MPSVVRIKIWKAGNTFFLFLPRLLEQESDLNSASQKNFRNKTLG